MPKFLKTFLIAGICAIPVSPSVAQSITAVGSLSQPTMAHSATLLDDGRVLVVATTGRSEVFSPSSNTWSLTASMAQGGEKHTATKLIDGRVLVVGGFVRRVVMNSVGAYSIDHGVSRAELFAPMAEQWSSAGALSSNRAFHTATRLANGDVLVVGGETYSLNPSTGEQVGMPVNSVERFSALTGQWAVVGALPNALSRHTATLLANEKIVLLGGINAAGNATTTCLQLDTTTYVSTACSPLPAPRSQQIATLLPSGQIQVSGGASATETFEPVYTPGTDNWAQSTLPAATSRDYAAVLFNQNSLIVWGQATYSPYSPGTNSSPPVFDAAMRLLTAQPSAFALPSPPVAGQTMTPLMDGRILVAGGYSSVRSYSTLGTFYYPDPHASSYVIDKSIPSLSIVSGNGRDPFAPETGERYEVLFGLSVGVPSPSIAPSGNLTLSDGDVSCSGPAAVGFQSCKFTTASSGPKLYSLAYTGDTEYKAATITYRRPVGNRLRIERYGNAIGTVSFSPMLGLSVSCGAAFSPLVSDCDPAPTPGTVVTLSGATASSATIALVGWQGACSGTADTCSVTMPATGSIVVKAYFAPRAELPLKLDIDANGNADAATDGQIIRRFMARIHDGALTQGVTGVNAQRIDPTAIEDRLNMMMPLLDVDQNGRADPNTDGLLILRYLLGFRDNALVDGALGQGAKRVAATDIAAHLQSLMP